MSDATILNEWRDEDGALMYVYYCAFCGKRNADDFGTHVSPIAIKHLSQTLPCASCNRRNKLPPLPGPLAQKFSGGLVQ